ncbi:MAG TPA: hypothetical protein DEB06_09355 [Phycisphaerales bacterium]|nr:hypothetical protein [Phycisphaerales bacterium]
MASNSDRSTRAGASALGTTPRFEPLEPRLLLSGVLPTITLIEADNRGLVVMTASRDLDASTVNANSVRVLTAGSDGLLGTADDALVNRQVSYESATRRIRVAGQVAADTRFRVVLDASVIRGTNGCFLDGEFNGSSAASGDGTEGGNLEFFTRRATTDIARFTTTQGTIDVELFTRDTPLTVQNFLNYANRGDWDTTFFHRGARTGAGQGPADFVVQGGGFSFASASFPPVRQDPAVRNEPVFSNVRGTIAMAKLGNNPNSATNQWFFNVSDNSQNLDNQNGGFTAFGEITSSAGLSVMDAIAALQRFNASSQNSAFNEVPVQNLQAATARGTLIASDLAQVTRVSLLVDITGEPTGQLPLEGSVLIANPNGPASVRVFDLDGAGLPDAAQFISVAFGPNDQVSQIRLLPSFPSARVGLLVSGSSGVGQIIDQRTSARGDVAFIVTNAGVSSVRMNHAISGYDLNGFVLPGLTLPVDIDGDGLFNDPVALYAPTGVLGTLDARGGLTGDVVSPGGIRTVRAGGLVSDANFVSDQSGAAVAAATYQFVRVADSGIDSAAPITSLRAIDWRRVEGGTQAVRAPSLTTLSITGDSRNGVAGDFDAALDLFAPQAALPALTSASIAGGVSRSAWEIAGNLNSLRINGPVSQWTADITGNIGPVTLGTVVASSIRASGDIGPIRAVAWDAGAITGRSTSQISITGDRRAGIRGDFGADATFNNPGTRTRSIGAFSVAGDFIGGVFRLTGSVNSFTVAGTTRNLDLEHQGGDVRAVSLREVNDSSFAVFSGTLAQLTATRWTGGAVRALTLNALTMTGDARNAVPGDFIAEFENGTLGSFTLANRGSLSGAFSVGMRAQSISVDGEVRGSSILMAAQSNTGVPVLRTLRVNGGFVNSEFRSDFPVDSLSFGSMFGSGVYIGAPNLVGLPDPGAQVSTEGVLGRIEVRGVGESGFGFEGSVIVAGLLRSASINEPRTDNFGQVFGLAGRELGAVASRIDGRTVTVNGNSASTAFGDYQVRVNLQPPAGS